MTTKKFLPAVIIAALGAAPAFARTLSPEEALARAVDPRQASAVPGRALTSAKPAEMRLARTFTDASGSMPAFYVFNSARSNGGFMIASADSRLRPVLAVADSGEFSDDSMPENMRWWLSQYEEEITAWLASAEAAEADDSERKSVYENYASWQPITPIVKTKWNQDRPYNNLCPMDGSNRTVTGCVATAMAQVVNAIGYYNGSGSNTYTSGTINKELTFDFGAWNCDFSKLRNEYEQVKENGTWVWNATEEELNEVATLMYACGVAVNMNYKTAAAGGSGAGSPLGGLVKYFGYDPSSAYVSRSGLQSPEWESLIYHQLSIGRPVYYAGTGEGGHAFVCDGYSENGFFHFNWGWGGMSDGYFALSALNPLNQGIGSFSGGYNMQQFAGFFVKPGSEPVDLPSSADAPCGAYSQGDIPTPTGSGNIFTFGGMWYTLLSSETGQPMEIGLTLRLEDPEGLVPDINIPPYEYRLTGLWNNNMQNSFIVNMKDLDLPAGSTWDAYIVFAVKGYDGFWDLKENLAPGAKPRSIDHYKLTVSKSGRYSFQKAEVKKPGIGVYEFSTNGIYSTDDSNLAECVVTNYSNRDFNEPMSLCLDKADGTTVMTIAKNYVLIRAGESVPVATYFSTKNLAAGTYRMRMYRDNYGTPIDDNYLSVKVKSGSRPAASKGMAPAGQCEVRLWVDGAESALAPVTIAKGESFAATTALSPRVAQELDYSLALFPHGSATNAVATFPVAKKSLTASSWVEGDAFSVTPDVPVGLYTMGFVDAYGTLLSYPVDFYVGLREGSVIYTLNPADNTLMGRTLASAPEANVVIPAEVKDADKSYPVSAIAEGLFDGCYNIESLTLPASLVSVGLNAFRGTLAMDHVFFNAPAAPFANSALAFYCVNPAVEYYVPAASYSDYLPAFPSSVGTLYASIGAITIPAGTKVALGKETVIDGVIDAASNFNPDITVSVANPEVLTAELRGSSLVVNGLALGETTVTLTSAQPGLAPVEATIAVVEKVEESSIGEIASDDLRVEYFDLAGRRVAAPAGITIRRTTAADGTVTTQKIRL